MSKHSRNRSRYLSSGLSTLLLAGLIGAERAQADQPSWYEDVILLEVDGRPFDTGASQPSLSGVWFEEEASGHAAPVLYDYDGDGLLDLLVGGFSGRFRVYLNEGTPAAPVFADYEWIPAGGDVATLYNFCSVAAGLRLVDLNGDGWKDLTAGSYAPGQIYWFAGSEEGFQARETLTDWGGIPIMTRLDEVAEAPHFAYGAKPAWIDWEGDGDLDLIIGNVQGDLVLRRNHGPNPRPGVIMRADQPVFDAYDWPSGQAQLDVFDFIEGGGGPLIEAEYLSPAAADWNGDGKVDLIVATQSGAVYLLTRLEVPADAAEDAARFAAPETLVPAVPGGAFQPPQLVEAGTAMQIERGPRASVDVADFNGDGRPDLIVGDWSRSIRPRPDLSDADRQAFRELQAQLVELDRRAGLTDEAGPFRERLRGTTVYFEDEALMAEMEALVQQLVTYLVPESDNPHHQNRLRGYERQHGRVWVYLRR